MCVYLFIYLFVFAFVTTLPPPHSCCPPPIQLSLRRAEYFSLSTKRSQAYAHAVQFGLGSVRGEEHLLMVATWKEEAERALVRVADTLLDKLFSEGE